MKKIGVITIGQSPRNDVMEDLRPILGNEIELLEKGALDNWQIADLKKLTFCTDDYILVSKMRDGSNVHFAERHIRPFLQGCICDLEAQQVKAIMFLCTGKFPAFQSQVPILYPNKILQAVVPALIGKGAIIVLTPSQQQLTQSKAKWSSFFTDVTPLAVSPYNNTYEDLNKAIPLLNKLPAKYILMDCIGYSNKMKLYLEAKTGKTIILARTMVARIARELLD